MDHPGHSSFLYADLQKCYPPVYELCSRGLRGDCVDLGTVVLGLGTEELYRSAYWG